MVGAKLMEKVGLKRLLVLALAGGVVALGIDVAVGHVLQNDGTPSKLQWVPIFLSPATFLLLVVGAAAMASRAGRLALLVAGGANLLVGLTGTFFHLKAILGNVKGALTWQHLTDALTTSPPSFAPGGFAAIGVVVLALASPRLLVRWEPRPAKAPAPVPQAAGLAPDT